MACDPQSLVDNAACIECGIPSGMQSAVIISLLCQILNNGGPGGGTQVFAADYSDAAPLFTPTTSAAIAFDIITGTQWNWYNGQWN